MAYLRLLLLVVTLLLSAGRASAQEGPYVPSAVRKQLSEAQEAYILRLVGILWCVGVYCGHDESAWALLKQVKFDQSNVAEGGLTTGPDLENPNALTPWHDGKFKGSNGDDVGKSGASNPIFMDPTSWTPPNAAGEVAYSPGTGINVEGAPAPGSRLSPSQDLLLTAAMMYGELRHQELEADLSNGKPSDQVSASSLKKSEAGVYERSAQFCLWLADCDACWGVSLTPEERATDRAQLLFNAKFFKTAARKFR